MSCISQSVRGDFANKVWTWRLTSALFAQLRDMVITPKDKFTLKIHYYVHNYTVVKLINPTTDVSNYAALFFVK
jgi:hypothetical protein